MRGGGVMCPNRLLTERCYIEQFDSLMSTSYVKLLLKGLQRDIFHLILLTIHLL